MITQEELNRRQPVVQKLLEDQLSGPKTFYEVEEIPASFIERKEASKLAGRNYKMLWRLFNLYGLDFCVKDGKCFYSKEGLNILIKEKKPKGMKAIGLGTIHKALLYRLENSDYKFEKEKRFPYCNLPFDIYLPEQNIAVEIQGPQHFFLAGNWTDSLEKAHENLAAQLARDTIKRNYCKSHGIDLIWITVDSDLNDFFKYLQDKHTCSEWFHRSHLSYEEWTTDFEKWLLFSYKKEEFLKEFREPKLFLTKNGRKCKMLKHLFDGSKIRITRVRRNNDWYGNAVHFRYEGQTYRASIREDPDSEDESGNRVNYAHLQIADANGNWGEDIAARDFVDEIPISINHLTTVARKNNYMRWSGHEPYPFPTDCKYDRAIPYKFYDTEAFADYLNSIFVE